MGKISEDFVVIDTNRFFVPDFYIYKLVEQKSLSIFARSTDFLALDASNVIK